MRMANNSAPERLAYLINEAAYRAKYGSHWMGHNDVNAIHGMSEVYAFHAHLNRERQRLFQPRSLSVTIKLPLVPAYRVLEIAIFDRKLDPELALECAEFWGFTNELV
jgi:hypothetical protein